MSVTVLIIDGSDTIRKVLRNNFEREGFQVLEAATGSSGFKIVNSEKPDIVVSEVFLPDMDGVELCKRIKDISAVPDVPFIFLTSVQDMLIENRALRAGANDYLIKVNITRQEILLRVELLLHRQSFAAKIERYSDMVLSGRIGVLSIWDILRFLQGKKLSGMLEIFVFEKRAGIFFFEGQIVDANFGKLKGDKALFQLPEIESGVFRFNQNVVAKQISFTQNTEELISELEQLYLIKHQAESN